MLIRAAAPLTLLFLAMVAGCGSTVYVSSPTPSATASGAASPTPTLPVGSPITGMADVFFAQFGAVPPPFHVRLVTTLTGTPSGTAITEADVDGADYAADLHVELVGAVAQDSQVIVVDETGYVADAGTENWRAFPDYETVPPINPFLGLDAAQWQELGADAGHGNLERLHSTTWRPADTPLAERFGDVVFDLWLDGDGMPVAGELSFTLADSNGTSSGAYHTSYSFSQVGAPVQIVAPAVPTPSPSASASP